MALVEITAMTFGPYGVGRLEGKSVMVPHSVPGDSLEVSVESERGGYSIARIDRIVSPGRSRRMPPCPFLPRCGGCDWQHIGYPEQIRWKAQVVANEFKHSLGVELDTSGLVAPSEQEFGYRSRVRLKVGRGGTIGFHESASNRLVEIDRCLVADCNLGPAAQFARSLSRDLVEIEVVRKSDTAQVLVGYLKKPATEQQVHRVSRLVEGDESIAGIVLRSKEQRSVVGDAEVEVEIEDGVMLSNDADLFSQVNRPQNRKLVAAAMEMAAPGPQSSMLDLFCGTGNFSIPAARRGARVTGVDSESAAVAAADRNARRMSLKEAQFVAMDARELAAFLHRARSRPEVVLLDPPRTGAAELMEPIVRLHPARVVYVSCDVATLARDLRMLCASKYRIERVRAFDFFPNTHHIEIAACAVLT
ncbi:MAG TPA: class I SAM-dependent RNA methyltransferase [Candidatus Binataceae bacterium]|nr:class I SAM-dependent RNA methyltransferase [Candidatus Binataceae bacterium]